VDVGPATVRYPDVVVDLAGGQFKDLTATAPALIAQVISPSSAKEDLGATADEYLRLPSLSAYLVFAQDEAKARAWVRGAGGFSPGPVVIEGQAAVIEIAALGINLPLVEIYVGAEHR
jgi:Uma2 family endonuclease